VTGFPALHALVTGDPALTRRLRKRGGFAAMADEAVSIAAEHGLIVGRDELRRVLDDVRRSDVERDVLAEHRSSPGPVLPSTPSPPEGFSPTGIDRLVDPPVVAWHDLDGIGADDPFYAQSVETLLRDPSRRLFSARTPLDALDGPGGPPPADVAGLVLHASRCGSTLVSNMLGALPGVTSVSEPPIVDAVLRGPEAPEVRVARLRRVVAHLAADAPAGDRLVLKLDCWSTADLDLLRQAFPGTPSVFVYREPTAILASQMRQRGMQTIPGVLPPELFGIDPAEMWELAPEVFAARVIGAVLRAAAELLPATDLLVHHAELPDAVAARIAPHFGLRSDDAALQDAAGRDAKAPHEPYDEARRRTERPVSDAVVAASAAWADEAYAALEARRPATLAGSGAGPC
jgi:hypothetical protein